MLHVDEPKRKGMNTISLNEGSLRLSASDKCMQGSEGICLIMNKKSKIYI